MDLYKYKNESENKKYILRTIYNEEGISRNELAAKSGLSLITVSKFVSELISDGIVEEYGTLESTGGRRSSMLRVNPNCAYIIGIDIGAHSTKIGVVQINGELVEKELVESNNMPAQGISLEELCAKIENIIEKYGFDRLLGIGVGISGMVDPDGGKVIFCPNISGWDGVNVCEILKKRFSVPVFLDTSFRCMALAEQWFGIGKGIKNQIFISIGYSIGAGIIIDSKIFRGNGGFSGELGHVQVEESGVRCTCGNYGCLELYATLPVIFGRIANNLAEFKGYSPLKNIMDNSGYFDKNDLIQALQDGDKIVYEDLMYVGKLIGIAIANMINIINPELVVLGGGVIEIFPIITNKVKETIRERALIPVQQNLTVKNSSLGWDGPLKGCSVLLISKFLE